MDGLSGETNALTVWRVLRSVLQNLLNMGKNHLESHATAVLMKNKNV